MYGQTVEAVVLPDAEDSRGRRLGVSYSWARSWLSAVIRRTDLLSPHITHRPNRLNIEPEICRRPHKSMIW